ncbi:GNAT family N-acetyltransferase [Xenorhabdus griffiniae]|uniref:GNAT family N-acetyltransferase n=1 Tax=Xenorhabdus griffiniae TaxID=351672 RepID=UPI0030D33FA5
MMFRSKSFNIHQPLASGSLTRTQSFSEKWPSSVNVRASIVIKEVNPQEALAAMRQIREEMASNGWKCGDGDSEQKKWNSRFTRAHNILGGIGINAGQPVLGENASFFVAYFRGTPIGGLQLSSRDNTPTDFLKVNCLATHCGIRDCGVLLIEQAVNKSQQLGKNGNLKLRAVIDAVPAYMKMGFVVTESYMELRPIESNDKWKYDGITNTYRYKFM